MNVHLIQRRQLVALIAALVVNNGLASDWNLTATASYSKMPLYQSGSPQLSAPTAPCVPGRYIVRFVEPAVPSYFESLAVGEGTQFSKAHKAKGRLGRIHLDPLDASVNNYAQYLRAQQSTHLRDIARTLGRSPMVVSSMQFALNAIVLDELTEAEAKSLSTLPSVADVSPDHILHVATDIGPGFIGASSIWFGTDAAQDSVFVSGFENQPGYRGDGVVIGDIDSGYNSLSPSFSATDEDGYSIQNPFGAGHYLGECSVANISLGGCNDKVIGVYDLTGGGAHSAEDSIADGHGSHTGSTAAGNARSATIGGFSARLSGVAPHANMVIYRSLVNGGGSLSSIVAAVDQAIQDGIVDVLNYSVSSGADPWSSPESLAFLSATEAGIFVAAAAGNTSGSVPVAVASSANNMGPWVTTVAAGNHSGGPVGYTLSVAGPGAPAPIGMNTAPGSTQPGGPIAATLAVSPNFNAANDCAAFPANAFAGKFAVVHYVSAPCTTDMLAANALAAGAAQVLIVNSTNDYLNSGAVQALPVFTTTDAQGNALVAYMSSQPDAIANVGYPADRRLPILADKLAGFSLLGPSTVDVIKPDLQAPGVSILASFANDGSVDGPDKVAFEDGTSMATPHTTGAGALLMGMHTDWTPMEVKSALMMTASESGLTKADGFAPSDFFDRGAGRLQAFAATRAGLVLHENGLNFSYANPANAANPTYVAPNALNLASMQSSYCVTAAVDHSTTATCAFTRVFRNTQDHAVTWTSSFSGDVSGSTTPASFTATNAYRQTLQIHADATAYNADGNFHFGELILTPDDPALPALHLPMAIKVPPIAITTDRASLSVDIPNGATIKIATLIVRNTGGPNLVVSDSNYAAGMGGGSVVDQAPDNNTLYANYWNDQAHGIYVADDFTMAGPPTVLTKLSFPGVATASLSGVYAGRPIHFEIYADNAGIPNGNPETVAPSYIWHYVATIGATPGLDVSGNNISLDLAVAPDVVPANLAPGKYWIVAYPEVPTFIDVLPVPNGWKERGSMATNGSHAQVIDPAHLFSGTTGAWEDVTTHGFNAGLAVQIEQSVPCGAPWMTTAPSTMTIGAGLRRPLSVKVNSANFPPGQTSASAFLCIASNDPLHPIYSVPVTATQN